MRSRKRLGTSLGEITVTEMGDIITIKQKRVHTDEKRIYPVSMTHDEARALVDNLSKRLALHETLNRKGLA
jgi:uncharacterized protein (DUF927 family)